MICAFDEDQFLRFRHRSNEALQLRPRPELVTRSTDEKFGLGTGPKKLVVVAAFVNGRNWCPKGDQSLHPGIRAGRPETHSSAKREAGKNYGLLEFCFEPVQRSADILDFPASVVVFTLTQSGATKIEAQHWKAKAVQSLHRVKDNLVVQRAPIDRMRVADQSCMARIFRTEIEKGLKPPGMTFEEERLDRGVGKHGRDYIDCESMTEMT